MAWTDHESWETAADAALKSLRQAARKDALARMDALVVLAEVTSTSVMRDQTLLLFVEVLRRETEAS